MSRWTLDMVLDALVDTSKIMLQMSGQLRSMAAFQHRDGEQIGVVMWADGDDVSKLLVRDALAQLGRALDCEHVFSIGDAHVNVVDSSSFVRPSDDPAAVDALVITHARRGSTLTTGWIVEYRRDDDGTLHFDERRLLDDEIIGAVFEAWQTGLNRHTGMSVGAAFDLAALASLDGLVWLATSERGHAVAKLLHVRPS